MSEDLQNVLRCLQTHRAQERVRLKGESILNLVLEDIDECIETMRTIIAEREK